jgi:flavin reductase (DIM6/NTAB) family NADH-FMN oxidoreductase RutF
MVELTPITDGHQLRQAFGCFASGVAAVCAVVDGSPVGLAASSFISVSVAPPIASVCVRHTSTTVQHTSTTWPVLRQRPRLGLSVLAEGQDAVCQRLANKNNKNGDRFAGTDWVSATTTVCSLKVRLCGSTARSTANSRPAITTSSGSMSMVSARTPKPLRSSFTVAASDALPSSDVPVGLERPTLRSQRVMRGEVPGSRCLHRWCRSQ